ncbi:hypothetical protein ElyMa_003100900 [Elysia marginata]|uniref:Secreted protein n=1 Tax=Elysia marginata TaxID=1093978 RepID=A0AAV4IPZ1_9GAST|nr:hypothetical protein ElyMa_003100900 [Elysia marginata]
MSELEILTLASAVSVALLYRASLVAYGARGGHTNGPTSPARSFKVALARRSGAHVTLMADVWMLRVRISPQRA